MGLNNDSAIFTKPINKLRTISPRFHTLPRGFQTQPVSDSNKFSLRHISANIKNRFSIHSIPKRCVTSLGHPLDDILRPVHDSAEPSLNDDRNIDSPSQLSSSIDIESRHTGSQPESTEPNKHNPTWMYTNHIPSQYVNIEGLTHFFMSQTTQALSCPYPIRLFLNSVGKISLDTIELNSLNDTWKYVGTGLFVFVFHKNLVDLPDEYKSVRLYLCEPITFKTLFQAKVALTEYDNCKPDQIRTQIGYCLKKDRSLDTLSHFVVVDLSHTRIQENKAHRPGLKQCAQKSSLPNSSKSETIFDFKEYGVCKLEFESDLIDPDVTAPFFDELEERLVRLLESRSKPNIQRQVIRQSRHQQIRQTSILKNQKQRVAFKSSISTPCMFAHVHSVKKEDLEWLKAIPKHQT